MYVRRGITRGPGRHINNSSDFNLGYVITRKLFENVCLRDHLRTWKKNILKVSYNTGIRGGLGLLQHPRWSSL